MVNWSIIFFNLLRRGFFLLVRKHNTMLAKINFLWPLRVSKIYKLIDLINLLSMGFR